MAAKKKTFEEWFKEVDRAIAHECGMAALDLSDQPYQDWYEDGVTPKQAAKRAIKAELE